VQEWQVTCFTVQEWQVTCFTVQICYDFTHSLQIVGKWLQILFAAQQKIRAPQCWRTKVTLVYLIIHDRVIVIQKVNSGSAFWKMMENVLMAKCDRPVQASPVHPVFFRYSGGTTEASKFFARFTFYTNLICVTAVWKLMSITVPSEHGYLSDILHGITPLMKAISSISLLHTKVVEFLTHTG